ncbi:MAG: Flp family type IVb pilin, partial [Planctomycetia bacterium]
VFTMRNLFNAVVDLVVAEDGPTAVEYAVMLSLIIVVCLAAIQLVGTKASTTFSSVGQSVA